MLIRLDLWGGESILSFSIFFLFFLRITLQSWTKFNSTSTNKTPQSFYFPQFFFCGLFLRQLKHPIPKSNLRIPPVLKRFDRLTSLGWLINNSNYILPFLSFYTFLSYPIQSNPTLPPSPYQSYSPLLSFIHVRCMATGLEPNPFWVNKTLT